MINWLNSKKYMLIGILIGLLVIVYIWKLILFIGAIGLLYWGYDKLKNNWKS